MPARSTSSRERGRRGRSRPTSRHRTVAEVRASSARSSGRRSRSSVIGSLWDRAESRATREASTQISRTPARGARAPSSRDLEQRSGHHSARDRAAAGLRRRRRRGLPVPPHRHGGKAREYVKSSLPRSSTWFGGTVALDSDGRLFVGAEGERAATRSASTAIGRIPRCRTQEPSTSTSSGANAVAPRRRCGTPRPAPTRDRNDTHLPRSTRGDRGSRC